MDAVHPRACGEQSKCQSGRMGFLGSSPRLRGTGACKWGSRSRRRFIPAPAGNSMVSIGFHSIVTVHPRACGEQRALTGFSDCSAGSSPRLRGTEVRLAGDLQGGRFIPAPAGNRGSPRWRSPGLSVHPRACGEQGGSATYTLELAGSSPRLRGTADDIGGIVADDRFIPAPAGNRRFTIRSIGALPVHPRACGEQFERPSRRSSGAGSSPRLRGTD